MAQSERRRRRRRKEIQATGPNGADECGGAS
jgi:hypothetical protein